MYNLFLEFASWLVGYLDRHFIVAELKHVIGVLNTRFRWYEANFRS